MANPNSKIIVIGGGLAGLMATIKLAEAGHHVDLISMVPCKRSHSVCAQGGINASVNTKGEGDSPQIHFENKSAYTCCETCAELFKEDPKKYIANIN